MFQSSSLIRKIPIFILQILKFHKILLVDENFQSRNFEKHFQREFYETFIALSLAQVSVHTWEAKKYCFS